MEIKIYRKIFYTIGCLLLTITCLAQNRDWKFSVNATPAISWWTASGDIKSDSYRFSFDFSVHAEKYFGDKSAFFTGLSFFRMSGTIKNISTAPISLKSGNLSLNNGNIASYFIQYLTVPVGIKLKTAPHGLFSYYVHAGLLPGIRAGSSVTIGDAKHSLSKDLNLMTCAVQVSPGVLYSLSGDNQIKAGITFTRFFVDAFSASKMKILPNSLGLQLGFVF
jgi:hypothetical protein